MNVRPIFEIIDPEELKRNEVEVFKEMLEELKESRNELSEVSAVV